MTHDERELECLAREFYPGNDYLQQQWLRGVRLVRTTARGWLLDAPPLPVPSRRMPVLAIGLTTQETTG